MHAAHMCCALRVVWNMRVALCLFSLLSRTQLNDLWRKHNGFFHKEDKVRTAVAHTPHTAQHANERAKRSDAQSARDRVKCVIFVVV